MAALALVDDIRDAAAKVASKARHVTIRAELLDEYAAELSRNAPSTSIATEENRDIPEVLSGATPEQRAAYALTLDAINFGSGWFPLLRKPEGHSGYRTIERALDARFAKQGPWSAGELAEISAGELAVTLGQDPALELIGLYADSLADLGARLLADHEGRFLGPVELADGSAVALVEELARWNCFADTSTYEGMSVPFFKRAQIAAADLHRVGAARFDDLDRLTLFADNLVPHVLKIDGVLEFESGMVERIASGVLLEHGATEEVEMRACAVHAVELLSELLPLAPFQLDRILWERGAGRRYKSVPRPRCRATAY